MRIVVMAQQVLLPGSDCEERLQQEDEMSKDERHDESLTQDELSQISGGRFKRNGVFPGYVPPNVLYDDGINILTTDPATTNVGYDSPFTPIPHPA
jgi:hypothetical protein